MRSFVRGFAALSLAISALALSATSARAGVVFSNDFDDPAGFTLNITSSNSYASGFTTGTNASFLNLTGVKLSLKTSSTASVPVVSIYSNAVGNNPGSLLTTLSGPASITNTVTSADYLFSGNLALSPFTSYWVVLSTSDATSSYQWEFANDAPVEQNLSGYAALGGRRKTTGSWGNNNSAADGMLELQAVPEPSTIVMACIGVSGAVALDAKRRRRRRATVESEEATV